MPCAPAGAIPTQQRRWLGGVGKPAAARTVDGNTPRDRCATATCHSKPLAAAVLDPVAGDGQQTVLDHLGDVR